MKPNAVEFHADVAILRLTQGKHAVVDIADYPWVSGHRWCAHKVRRQYYACTYLQGQDGKQATLQMHRLLMPDAQEVDHINHNGCDNTRANIRACTRAQNQMNGLKHRDGSSRFKGVHWFKAHQKWQSYIYINRAQIHLGLFTSETEAAHAYDAAAREYFGEFACLNFPKKEQPNGGA